MRRSNPDPNPDPDANPDSDANAKVESGSESRSGSYCRPRIRIPDADPDPDPHPHPDLDPRSRMRDPGSPVLSSSRCPARWSPLGLLDIVLLFQDSAGLRQDSDLEESWGGLGGTRMSLRIPRRQNDFRPSALFFDDFSTCVPSWGHVPT